MPVLAFNQYDWEQLREFYCSSAPRHPLQTMAAHHDQQDQEKKQVLPPLVIAVSVSNEGEAVAETAIGSDVDDPL